MCEDSRATFGTRSKSKKPVPVSCMHAPPFLPNFSNFSSQNKTNQDERKTASEKDALLYYFVAANSMTIFTWSSEGVNERFVLHTHKTLFFSIAFWIALCCILLWCTYSKKWMYIKLFFTLVQFSKIMHASLNFCLGVNLLNFRWLSELFLG